MLKYLTPSQRAVVLDTSPHVSALCPRRAGKTLAAALAALITGEAKPGAVSIIISLNKQQLRRLYWKGGSSGLWTLAHKFNLNVKFHGTYLSWEHENGSMGYLLGADDDEQLEVIRGLEADLYVIDECKSFAVPRLSTLIDDIIDPQRSSRQGRILLIGTPGFTAAGPFWQATNALAKDSSGKPFLVEYGKKDAWGRTPKANLLWSFHHWTLQETAPCMAHQWEDALLKKAQRGWGDEHPTWIREYLGRWTTSGDGMVFRYANEKGHGRVTWVPNRTDENPTGLPPEGAPWRLVGGLDLGFEAPTAFVVLAYSARLRQIRHVWDYSRPHLLVHDIAELIRGAIQRFGNIEKIYADQGNLGKTIVNTLIADGFPLEAAEKREKNDYIELINAAFEQGELLVVEGNEYNSEAKLEEQLLTNVWDLGDEDKTTLARLGKLREDNSIPNDSTDALVYGFRGALHRFGYTDAPPEHAYGTPKWVEKWEREQLAAARRPAKPDAHLGTSDFAGAPSRVRKAMRKQDRWTTPRPTR